MVISIDDLDLKAPEGAWASDLPALIARVLTEHFGTGSHPIVASDIEINNSRIYVTPMATKTCSSGVDHG